MARPWRLRHKLVLLLGLVLAAVGLLLAGTWYGMTAYRGTVDAAQGKAAELQVVFQLQAAVGWATGGNPELKRESDEPQLDFERRQVLTAVDRAGDILAGYRQTLAATAARRRADTDPDVLAFVADIEAGLGRLRAAADATAGSLSGASEGRLVGPHTPAGAEHARLVGLVNTLHGYLVEDINRAIDRSRGSDRRAMGVAGAAAVLALILLATLLHYFRVWVFAPIREVQAGVQRVRAGEFDRPIRLASQDEFAEVADEFDAMTARLKEVNADLRRQVTERTKQLVRSEKMVSVGFLAAGVAHEINNPLASIAFCAEALESRLNDLLSRAPASESEVVLKYLRMMQEEAQRCKDITQRLLDFARGGGQRGPADLAQIVQSVVDMTALTPNARGKTVRFHHPGPVPAVVSAQEIKSVVLNIVVNALDSMDAGGVLDVRLARRGDTAELVFTDTGCGMTADTLDNIFEPFFTRSKTGQGTGLGLSISHQIVDQHGGTVTASSPGPGKGSTFTVRLPLTDAAPDTLPFPAARAAA